MHKVGGVVAVGRDRRQAKSRLDQEAGLQMPGDNSLQLPKDKDEEAVLTAHGEPRVPLFDGEMASITTSIDFSMLGPAGPRPLHGHSAKHTSQKRVSH